MAIRKAKVDRIEATVEKMRRTAIGKSAGDELTDTRTAPIDLCKITDDR